MGKLNVQFNTVNIMKPHSEFGDLACQDITLVQIEKLIERISDHALRPRGLKLAIRKYLKEHYQVTELVELHRADYSAIMRYLIGLESAIQLARTQSREQFQRTACLMAGFIPLHA